MAMELIETIEVGAGGTASIEFTSIPQDGVDLLLVLSGRSSTTSTTMNMQINGDTASNYTWKRLFGDGSSASSFGNTTDYIYTSTVPSNWTSNTFSSNQVYFSNYTSSSAKSVSVDEVTENNASTAYHTLVAGSWSGTSAITSIKFSIGGANLVQYSTASLYKIY